MANSLWDVKEVTAEMVELLLVLGAVIIEGIGDLVGAEKGELAVAGTLLVVVVFVVEGQMLEVIRVDALEEVSIEGELQNI